MEEEKAQAGLGGEEAVEGQVAAGEGVGEGSGYVSGVRTALFEVAILFSALSSRDAFCGFTFLSFLPLLFLSSSAVNSDFAVVVL